MKWTRRNILIFWGNILYNVFGYLLPIVGIISLFALLHEQAISPFLAAIVCLLCASWIVIANKYGSSYAQLYLSMLDKIGI